MIMDADNSVKIEDLQGQTFHFVIVGGGTAGCLIAARLATELPACRILVVEAGKEIDKKDLIPGYTKPRFGSSDGNWMYETVAQTQLNGRKIPYPRGRGMGGCSGNNFMAWVRGPKADFDDWAELVGDSWWRWDNVLPYMKRLEDFRAAIPADKEQFAKPTPGFHGSGGPFSVGYGQEWQPLVEYCMEASQEAGHQVNLDNNDGDPLGLSVAQFNVDNGTRVTSASAFLNDAARSRLQNLVVVTESIVSKILFSKKRAVGVQILPTIPPPPKGKDNAVVVRVSEEVILTAGCFQSPQLLLLSGIGPASHLRTHSVPIVHDLPGVGQNLQDHTALACEFIIKPSIPGHNQLLHSPTAIASAIEQYESSGTGPLAVFGASAAIIFPILPSLHTSPEFRALPSPIKSFMQAPTRPSTEIWMHSGPLFYTGPCPTDVSVLVIEGLCQNNLSRGNVQLASTNARTMPLINPGYLSHPYDLRIAVETVREIIKIAKTPTFSEIIEDILLGPRSLADSDSLASISGEDDEILEQFVRETLTQGFHSMSTCVMGREGDQGRVVDADFRVCGVEGVRVADMSVCPILTSNHTQINAYLIGERCVEFALARMRRKSNGKL